jgi:hypothetical protein
MSRAKTIVTAGVLLYVNNRPYGQVTSFRFNSDTIRNAIYGIDSIDPFELAPSVTKIAGSIGLVRTLYDGGAEGAGLTTSFEKLPKEKYFSLTLVEKSSDTVIFRADYCSVTRQNWDFESKGIAKGNVEFEALTWSNEVKSVG